MTETTVGVSNKTKKRLIKLKNVPEEYYDSVITRLLEFYEKNKVKK